MQIQILANGYTKHGCNILPDATTDVAMIEYGQQVSNHEFGGAYKKNGLFDWLETAEKVMKEHYPTATISLGIPDLVFRIPKGL